MPVFLNSLTKLLVLAVALPLLTNAAAASSIRFFGNGVNDIDRIKIRIDNPETPADVGGGDFTIEFWVRGFQSDYTTNSSVPSGSCLAGSGRSWIEGNIILDRALWGNDVFGDFGISIFRDGVAFGVGTLGDDGEGVCGTTDVLDGQWHHVAVTRAFNGAQAVFVDGQLEDQTTGLSGDVSYDGSRSFGNGDDTVDPYIILGAEKYSLGSANPSFNGWMEELRISNSVRYSGNFSPPTVPFVSDSATVALYHFDEGVGTVVNDVSGIAGGPSNGNLSIGGSPSGPVWSTETPFSGGGTSTVALQGATVDVDETGSQVTVTVTRTGDTTNAVSVDYATAAQSATAGADYTDSTGVLSWSSGDGTNRTINVPILDDGSPEGDETFSINLSNATGASLGNATTVVTIIDNDQANPGTIGFSTVTESVGEATPTVTLTVQRSGGADGAVSVEYATADGTATAGQDYQSASNTLNWGDGDSSDRTVVISLLDDSVFEGDETFDVTLSNFTGGAATGATFNTVTILEDDTGSPGQLQLAASSYVVDESAGTVSASVTRVGGTFGAISIDFETTDGSAVAGSDYTSLSDTLSWADGDSAAKQIIVTILDDAVNEAGEEFNIALLGGTITGGATLGSPASAAVTVNDNDAPPMPGSLQFSVASVSVDEESGSVALMVTRSGGSSGTVTVNYASQAGTAVAGQDYTTVNGSLSWPDGDQAARTINVSVIGNSDDDGSRDFEVVLSAPSGASLGSPSRITVTITDDDNPPPPPPPPSPPTQRSSGGGAMGLGGLLGLVILVGLRQRRLNLAQACSRALNA